MPNRPRLDFYHPWVIDTQFGHPIVILEMSVQGEQRIMNIGLLLFYDDGIYHPSRPQAAQFLLDGEITPDDRC